MRENDNSLTATLPLDMAFCQRVIGSQGGQQMLRRENWEIAYVLLVDGKETNVQLIGSSKHDALTRLTEEWELCYPDQPLPARKRRKLEELDRTFVGYK